MIRLNNQLVPNGTGTNSFNTMNDKPLFLFISTALLLGAVSSFFYQKTPASTENGEAIYNQYCVDCHGPQLQKFKNKDWKKGLSAAQVKEIISLGTEDQGMPAFGEALSAGEIDAVAEFILQYEFDTVANATVLSSTYPVELVVDGLEIPWGMEFLPNGEMLIAERKGKLSRLTKDKQLIEISGLPPVRARGQGGLMDLKLHPDYAENGWLYISYSYIDEENSRAGNTAIIRAKLEKDQLADIQPIYKGYPAVETSHHFGSRMVFDRDGDLFFTNGERGKRDRFPQSLDNTNGKVHRLHDDGSIPEDNPFVDFPDAAPSIYSYGHRNPQGIAMHPVTGQIWESEHGPKGGDEINLIEKGKNYGWPVISYGINYNGTVFTELTEKEGMEQPLYYYVPSIAPCGMAFISTDRYGDWKNSLLIGSLSFRYLERIQFDEQNKVIVREKLLQDLNSRVRDVREGPDGYIYVALEEPGRIIKLLPYR